MNTLSLKAFCLLLIITSFTATAQKTDLVQLANLANQKKLDTEIVDENVAQFLVAIADGRMMGMKEGKLASQKGSTHSIQEYGLLMLTDQTVLLGKIRGMAIKLNVTLPADISNDKENGLEDLAKQGGRNFDQTFMKMMIIDHERDIRLFEKALECKDRDVRAFAQEYLPLIQSHLSKINQIKESSE